MNICENIGKYVNVCENLAKHVKHLKETYTSLWKSMNTHDNLRASEQYGAAGSKPWIPSTLEGGALVW